MQNDKPSKGKGTADDWDMQSLQSLSLSDCGDYNDYVPRSTSFDHLDESLISAPFQTAGQQYTKPTNYRHDPNPPAYQDAAYPAVGTGYDPYIDFMSRGYTGSAADYGETASTVSAGAASSVYRGSDWDAASQTSHASASTARGTRTVASSVSSAPSRHSQRSTVETHIARQAPLRQRYQLQCEVCSQMFDGDDDYAWKDHTEAHLGGTFPSKLKCWFCEDLGNQFDSQKATGGDKSWNFQRRMDHIRDHIMEGDYRLHDKRPDGFLIQHLVNQGLIDENMYKDLLRPSTLPQMATSGHHHHHHRSLRHLAPVEEEAGPSSSSASKHRRSEKRSSDRHRESRRDSHHKKKSTK